MIRSTLRRAVTIGAVSAAVTLAGLPLFTGTALAATVSPSPSTVANSGTATVTLTAGATAWTATAATLTKHDQPSYTISASGLSTGSPLQPTTRTAQFPLLNKLPGAYDITLTESTGNETCSSCFTVTGLPPTIDLAPPTQVVTGSTADGTLTVNNPARGADYPSTRVQLEMSGVVNLHADQMTLAVAFSPGTWTPVTLSDSGSSIVGFIGSPSGTHLGQNQSLSLPLRFGVVSGAPTGTLHTTATLGDVNTSTGALSDALATDDTNTNTKVSSVAAGSTYHAMTPVRVLDTRVNNGHSGALAPSGTLTLVVGGTHGVPSGATAVAMNITATGGTRPGAVFAYPAGTTAPNASDVDYSKGVSAANPAVVPLNAV